MTDQILDVGVVNQGHLTTSTAHDVAAVAAENEGRVTASVQEEDNLFAQAQREFDRLTERRAEDRSVAGPKLGPEIDYLDRRQTAGTRTACLVRRQIRRRPAHPGAACRTC